MAKLIKDWEELEKCSDMSDTHYLDIDEYCGWIRCHKTNEVEYYLSTHTFYERNYKYSTELLQKCGFDVELQSWG